MTVPLTGSALLPLGVVVGFVFGWLLQRSRLTDTNVIVNQARLKDFTLVKMMVTAILVGGFGILVLHGHGLAAYHIKPANLLAVALGASLFGVGMVIYGYCPGTGLGAIGTGSIHALIGAVGMLVGAVAFAYSYDWLSSHIMKTAALGAVRLPEWTGIASPYWFLGLAIVSALTLLRR
jgi:uncharacterized protein